MLCCKKKKKSIRDPKKNKLQPSHSPMWPTGKAGAINMLRTHNWTHTHTHTTHPEATQRRHGQRHKANKCRSMCVINKIHFGVSADNGDKCVSFTH